MYYSFCTPWSGGYFGGGIRMMMMIIVVGFIVWFVTRESRMKKDCVATSAGTDRSLQILKERYAKGEIDQEEFEQKKKDLLS